MQGLSFSKTRIVFIKGAEYAHHGTAGKYDGQEQTKGEQLVAGLVDEVLQKIDDDRIVLFTGNDIPDQAEKLVEKLLRNGQVWDQGEHKIRTKEDLARLVGKRFETDSAEMIDFLNSPDSLSRFGAEPEYALWNVLPNTYTYFWNSSASKIYQKLYDESRKFWNEDRKKKASAIGLSPLQVYTLASIIEEETTNHSEKDTIASVYLNRLRTGMPLGADPTLKFAVKDFSLKRIYGDILNVESPYNTYRNRGLPPGPICTPSQRTIDAVLDPAETKFLYFVANRELNGHLFSEDYDAHLKKRAGYLEQDKQRRENNSKTPSR